MVGVGVGGKGGGRVGWGARGGGHAQGPASLRSSTTSRAMAGEPAMPGESMPAAWMSCGSVSHL